MQSVWALFDRDVGAPEALERALDQALRHGRIAAIVGDGD